MTEGHEFGERRQIAIHREHTVGDQQGAVVFGSGYLPKSGIIPVLIGPEGLVLLDEHAQACL
jgi:7-keto-8-aminopelargonate synthetase-like enzyme